MKIIIKILNGFKGAHIPSPPPANYQDFMINPKDMDFVKMIESSRNDIYNAYHIPLPLVTTEKKSGYCIEPIADTHKILQNMDGSGFRIGCIRKVK